MDATHRLYECVSSLAGVCLILFALEVDPNYRLVLAANRDEFHRRRSAAVHRWDDLPVIGGRDLEAGGTWLGLAPDKYRLAAVTNVRDGIAQPQPDKRSRGGLPVDFVTGTGSAADAAAALVETADRYAPVNLLVDDGAEMWWATNHLEPRAVRVEPGIHGLSNGALDEPWPKVTAGTAMLRDALTSSVPSSSDPEALLDALHDTTVAEDAALPHTGVPLDNERALSAMFVDMGEYGTRAGTVVRIDSAGHGDITERRYAPDQGPSTVAISV